jgi:hypothetical protein
VIGDQWSAEAYALVAGSDRADDSTARLARQILWNVITGSIRYRTTFF